MWCLSVKCHFANGLYIQTSLAVNCLPATSEHYYHTYAQKWWSGKSLKKKYYFFFCCCWYFHIREVPSHSRECGSWAAFPGGSRMIREGSHVCTKWAFGSGELKSTVLLTTTFSFYLYTNYNWEHLSHIPWELAHTDIFKVLYLAASVRHSVSLSARPSIRNSCNRKMSVMSTRWKLDLFPVDRYQTLWYIMQGCLETLHSNTAYLYIKFHRTMLGPTHFRSLSWPSYTSGVL